MLMSSSCMGPGDQFIHGGIVADSQRNRKMFNSTLTHPCLPKEYQYIRKTPWRREWQPTPVFLPGKSQWGHKESHITEHTGTHTRSPPSSIENKSNIKPNNKYKSDTVLSYHKDYCFGFISEIADFLHSDSSILFS